MKLEDWIKQKIEKDFSPTELKLVNESHKHAGHAGDDGSGQTHFKLIVVSSAFEGLNRVSRQRLINESLKGAFEQGLHALSMRLFSPEEYN